MIDPEEYSFFQQAAAEARAESQRYWAKGGAADKRWPQKSNPGWYAPLPRAVRQQAPDRPAETDIAKLVKAAKRRLGRR